MKKNLILILMLFSFQHLSSSQDQHLIDSLQTMLKNAKQDTTKANILFRLFKAFVDSDFDKAGDYARQSLALSEQIGYKKGIGRAYNSLAGIGVMKGDYLPALELYKKSLRIMEEIGDKKGIATSYYNTGNIYHRQGNYPEALKNLSSALKIFEETGDKRGIADIYNMFGNLYSEQGNYTEALKNHYAALKIYEGIADRYRIAFSYNNIGQVYESQGNYPESQKKYLAALKIFEETGNKEGVAVSYNNIGNIYYHRGNFREALKNYFAALKIYEGTGIKYGIAATYSNIGSVYDDQGNYPAALKSLFAALKINEELGHQNDIAISYYNIGVSYTKQKKYNDASQYLNKALSLSKEIGSLENISSCYEYLSIVDSAQGNYKKALEFYKMHITARDSLVNEENTRKTVQLQMQYEFDKKESLAKVEQEKKDAIAQEELQKQRYKINQTRILFAGIGSIFIIILLVILLRIERKRFKSDRKALVLEQRLLRSQMNPHFIFNSLSSIQNFIVTEKPDKASLYLSRFARLVRNILDNSLEEYVVLEKEISTIENYLELQKVRYAGKFDYRIHIADEIDTETLKIPPMLAQPFIENAIEHGIKYRETPGHIDIRFSLKDHSLIFEVEDDGIGRQKAREIAIMKDPEHKSMATSLTRERLANLNRKLNEKIRLEIVDLINALGEGTGTRVTFGFPLSAE